MTKSIGYGVYDGYATGYNSDTGEIWTCFDGGWHVPSRPTQVLCFECATLSEAEYRRLFDKYDLPPLPANAFTAA